MLFLIYIAGLILNLVILFLCASFIKYFELNDISILLCLLSWCLLIAIFITVIIIVIVGLIEGLLDFIIKMIIKLKNHMERVV